MKHITIKNVLILAVILLSSSCIRQSKTWILQDSKNTTSGEYSNPVKTAYKIKPGDNLYINVFSTDKGTSAYFQTNYPQLMSQTYLHLNSYIVNEEGYISFSVIEKMMVKGLTVEEVQQKLQSTLSSYFKDVTVSVKMVSYMVSVIGEVESPGKFRIPEEQSNILEIIAMAGGFKEYANRKEITIVRQTDSGSQILYTDLTEKNALSAETFYLMPHDVVYVKSLKSKSTTYEKLPYGVLISTLSLIIAVLALTQN